MSDTVRRILRGMLRAGRTPLVLVGLTLPTSGCLMAAPSAFQLATYAADGASYATTGKTVTDHLISEVTARDCAMNRLLDGEDVCKEKEVLRNEDGTLVINARDASMDVVSAHNDAAFQSFATTQQDDGADESLDTPAPIGTSTTVAALSVETPPLASPVTPVYPDTAPPTNVTQLNETSSAAPIAPDATPEAEIDAPETDAEDAQMLDESEDTGQNSSEDDDADEVLDPSYTPAN